MALEALRRAAPEWTKYFVDDKMGSRNEARFVLVTDALLDDVSGDFLVHAHLAAFLKHPDDALRAVVFSAGGDAGTRGTYAQIQRKYGNSLQRASFCAFKDVEDWRGHVAAVEHQSNAKVGLVIVDHVHDALLTRSLTSIILAVASLCKWSVETGATVLFSADTIKGAVNGKSDFEMHSFSQIGRSDAIDAALYSYMCHVMQGRAVIYNVCGFQTPSAVKTTAANSAAFCRDADGVLHVAVPDDEHLTKSFLFKFGDQCNVEFVRRK